MATGLSLIGALALAPTALGLLLSSHDSPVDDIRAHGDSVCDGLAGTAFLDKYRIDGERVEELVSTSGLPSSSSFKCSALWSTRTDNEAAAADFMCQGRNLKLVINDAAPVGLQVGPGSSWKLPPGESLKLEALYGQTLDVTLMNSDPNHDQCDETDNNTIVLYQIVDAWNPYEGGHQLLMTYASVLALKQDPKHLRMLLTKPYDSEKRSILGAASWMYDFVSTVFSKGGPVMIPSQTPARTICANNVVVPIGGGNSMLLRNKGRDDPAAASCRGGAPLLSGMRQFVLRAMGVQPASPAGSSGARVIMPLRLPNNVHPGKFLRVLENYQEVADALKGTRMQASSQLERDAFALAHLLLKDGTRSVTIVSLETIPIAEQVQLYADADIVIAPHSAALVWMYLMPKCGRVIEFCTGADYHYVNEAHYAGLDHRCLPGLHAWGQPSFTANVEGVVNAKRAAEEAWKTCVAAATESA